MKELYVGAAVCSFPEQLICQACTSKWEVIKTAFENTCSKSFLELLRVFVNVMLTFLFISLSACFSRTCVSSSMVQ